PAGVKRSVGFRANAEATRLPGPLPVRYPAHILFPLELERRTLHRIPRSVARRAPHDALVRRQGRVAEHRHRRAAALHLNELPACFRRVQDLLAAANLAYLA